MNSLKFSFPNSLFFSNPFPSNLCHLPDPGEDTKPKARLYGASGAVSDDPEDDGL